MPAARMYFKMLAILPVLIPFIWCPLVQGKLQAHCSYNVTVSKDQNASKAITLTGILPPSNSTQPKFCVVTVEEPNGFLRVRARKTSNSSGALTIFLHGDGSTLLGQVDVSQPAPHWKTLSLCPPSSAKTFNKNYLSIFGTSGLSFEADVSSEPATIILNEPQTVPVESDDVTVFQFIPPIDLSDKQLDITVTSQSDVPAYLKVSQNCEDIQENIEFLDYKEQSLRLSFAKKARITLSKVSVPPLTGSLSRWFIGISLKKATGSVSVRETKHVIVQLTQSFGYNYAKPISALVFTSFSIGVLVSLWAMKVFKQCFYVIIPSANVVANSNTQVGVELQNLPPGGGESYVRYDIKCNDVVKVMLKVFIKYWFSGGPKTFSYTTGLVGLLLFLGAFQVVFSIWNLMIEDGDRDSCFYNEFCYRVLFDDMPFNLMISNLPYIIHGLTLAFCVWYMETEFYVYCKKRSFNVANSATDNGNSVQSSTHQDLPNHLIECRNVTAHILEEAVPRCDMTEETKRKLKAEALKRSYSYSVGYAFSWALIFQGLFSTIYHMCPNRFTFQFDLAIMFVMAALIVLLLYNGIELNDECSINSERAKYPVRAVNFFFFFIVPLFIFNYLGLHYHTHLRLAIVAQALFLSFLFIWWVFMVWWACYKINRRVQLKGNCSQNKENLCWLFLGIVVPPILFLIYVYILRDLSRALLFSCIAESVFAVCAKTKFAQKVGELLSKIARCCCHCSCHSSCQRPSNYKRYREICQGLYISFMVIVLIAALIVFMALPTTHKTSSPEDSRDENKECAIFGFFDWHDLWHLLSSIALLMGAFVVMFIATEPVQRNGNSGAVLYEAQQTEAQKNETGNSLYDAQG